MQTQRFKRGQIWWYASSGGIGDKENIAASKTRPMLIVSNDLQNKNSNYVIAVPLTTAEKKDYPFHTKCMVNNKQSIFLSESLQSCNKDFFSYYIETADEDLMRSIENNLRNILGLEEAKSKPRVDIVPRPLTLADLSKELTSSAIQTTPIETETTIKRNKPGRKPSYTTEDKIRFINDYENHDEAYMLKKYNLKNKKTLQQKVYMFRKAIKGE